MVEWKSEKNKPTIGVSSCLMGNSVRFDGGHKNFSLISKTLRAFMELVTVCPEVEAGFGIPRPAMQLRLNNNEIKLVISRDQQDVTEVMKDFTEKKVPQLSHLDGFIFKKNSPSCGVFKVPVVKGKDGYKSREGVGIFSQAFINKYPLIPIEEEGRLNDKLLRENFFERVYAYRRWRLIPNPESNLKGFYEFHRQHKLMLMGRGSTYYQELGQIVAGTTKETLLQRREAYIQRFMQVMKITSRRGRQVNVLLHILGYMKKALSRDDKQELLEAFEAYRLNHTPLITPITLLKHYIRRFPQPYIQQQYYLEPFPEQLALRSFH